MLYYSYILICCKRALREKERFSSSTLLLLLVIKAISFTAWHNILRNCFSPRSLVRFHSDFFIFNECQQWICDEKSKSHFFFSSNCAFEIRSVSLFFLLFFQLHQIEFLFASNWMFDEILFGLLKSLSFLE